tara:strand:- start:188 stop:1264 length:1077 start_codon:yes stop_codon:yes gene_type:complete
LFLTTGLIKYCPSNEALIGVIAHELGHLDNFHITKRIESINNLKTFSQIGNLSLIASSIFSNSSENLIQSMVLNQVGVQNYYASFTKEQEREADIYAVQTLNKLNLSAKPLKKFLRILENKSIKKGINQDSYKFSTHPIYEERYEIIDNFSNNNNRKITDNFKFIQAKLFGFTEENELNLNDYLENDYYIYANSIFLSRKGKLKESLIMINKLIEKYPKYFYLFETKADLLFSHGYSKEANKFYKLVFNQNNENKYVKKRIFEINYENISENNDDYILKLFNENTNLFNHFYYDNVFLNKYYTLSLTINKNYWSSFIEANIAYNKNKKKELLINKLNKILEESKDKKLKYLIKQRLNL